MAPKNVLPISPMNIFAGLQLNNKKPINEPIRIDNSGLCKNNDLEKIINAHPANNPSNPSMKLKIFINNNPTKAIGKIINDIGWI